MIPFFLSVVMDWYDGRWNNATDCSNMVRHWRRSLM